MAFERISEGKIMHFVRSLKWLGKVGCLANVKSTSIKLRLEMLPSAVWPDQVMHY